MKIIILTLSIIIFILVAMALFTDTLFFDVKPIYKVIAINSRSKSDSIFLKRKVWGMTSDSQIIVISKSSKEFSEPNHQKDYIYGNLPDLFYKQEGDTLFIHSIILAEVPANFISEIIIIQKKITNREMMNLISSQEYLKKGLKSIND